MDWTDLVPYLALIFIVYVRSRREKDLMAINRDLTAGLAQLKNPGLAPYIGAAVSLEPPGVGHAAEDEDGAGPYEDERLGE